jgi:hypothetical protein
MQHNSIDHQQSIPLQNFVDVVLLLLLQMTMTSM